MRRGLLSIRFTLFNRFMILFVLIFLTGLFTTRSVPPLFRCADFLSIVATDLVRPSTPVYVGVGILGSVLFFFPVLSRLSANGFFLWFVACVAFVVILLQAVGLTLFSMLTVLIYISACAVVLLVTYLVSDRAVAGGIMNRGYGLIAIPAVLYGAVVFYMTVVWITGDPFSKEAGNIPAIPVFSERTEQVLFQKALFFDNDLMSFLLLFSHLLWTLVLVGGFLSLTAIVAEFVVGGGVLSGLWSASSGVSILFAVPILMDSKTGGPSAETLARRARVMR